MSTNAIEKLLWQINSNPAEVRRFRENPQTYVNGFRLDDEERSLLLSWNVSALASRDVSPLLLMSTFTAVNGMDKLMEYLTKIHQPSGHSAG